MGGPQGYKTLSHFLLLGLAQDPDTKLLFLVLCPLPFVYLGDIGSTFTLSFGGDAYQGFSILVALRVCVALAV